MESFLFCLLKYKFLLYIACVIFVNFLRNFIKTIRPKRIENKIGIIIVLALCYVMLILFQLFKNSSMSKNAILFVALLAFEFVVYCFLLLVPEPVNHRLLLYSLFYSGGNFAPLRYF